MDSKESHNYYKLAYIVIDIVSDVLREVFRGEWDSRYPSTPWNDNDGGISLGRFQSYTSVRKLTFKDRQHYYKLTNDCKTWDTSLLRYALVNSHPINPIGKPLLALNASMCTAVVDLANIRNTVCHKEKAFYDDATFTKMYTDIKTAIRKLGSSFESYVKEMKKVKRGNISPEVERLKQAIIEVKKELAAVKMRENMERLIFVGVITMTFIGVGLIYSYFVPPFVAAYFPLQNIPVTYIGRNEEITTAVGSVNNGKRITSLYGPAGIGKRLTGLRIGKILQGQWLPFPWMTVAFVSFNGDNNLFALQKSLLEAFFLFPETNMTYCMKQFFSSDLRRQTVIVINVVADIFQSVEGRNAKDLLSQLLAWNKGIQIILLQKKPIQFVDFSVENIPLGRLSPAESETLLQDLSPALTGPDLQFAIEFCKGNPLVMNFFSILYKHNPGLPGILSIVFRTHIAESDDEDMFAVLSPLFHSMTEDIQNFLLSLWYPKTVEVDTVTKSFPSLISGFVNAGLIQNVFGQNQDQKWTSHNMLHKFAQKVCYSSARESQVFKTCLKLGHDFQRHYMSLVSQCANKFFQQDVQDSLPVPLVPLNEQYNVKKMFSNGEIYKDLYASFYETVEKASTFFLFGIQEDIFSKYIFYKAANMFKQIDIGCFMTVLYLQSDKGDVYFYNHPNPYEKVSVIVSEAVDLFDGESQCEIIKDRKQFGICILVQGRVTSLHERKLNEKIMHDPEKGLRLIEKAEGIFESDNLKFEMASALSSKGVVLLTMKKYSKALTAYQKAHAILLNLPLSRVFLAASHYNMAYCYYKLAGFNLLDAVFHFNKSFSIFNHTLGLHRRTANAVFFHGSALQSLGKYHESFRSLEAAYSIQQQVIYLHTDISQAPRDQAELMYMKFMYEQTNHQLDQQLAVTITPGDVSLQASFTAYALGNCKSNINDVPAAEQNFKLAQDILSRKCEEVQGFCYYYDSVMKDVAVTMENCRMRGGSQMHSDNYASVLEYCVNIVLYGTILLAITVLFMFLLVRNIDFEFEVTL